MIAFQEELFDILTTDTALLAMLEANEAWYNPELQQSKTFSLIPVEKAPLSNGPYLTYQMISNSKLGYELSDGFFAVRCYNSKDKTHVEINAVLARVKALLHRHRFNLPGYANVETEWLLAGSDEYDESFAQNYREIQFRVLYI